MSEEWVQTCQKILDQIDSLSSNDNKDRLDLIQSMRFSLYALHRSILGWLNWVNNPDIMVSFSQEELAEMNKKLKEFIKDFIKYDAEVTEQGASKNITTQKATRETEERMGVPEDIFYI